MSNKNPFDKAAKNVKFMSAEATVSTKNQRLPVNLVAQLKEYGANIEGVNE